jgi:DNA-binding PadR family transcriptional regulator
MDEQEPKKEIKKQIIYRLTEGGHKRLQEIAFRETMKTNKRVSQSRVIDIALEEMYNRHKRFWNL